MLRRAAPLGAASGALTRLLRVVGGRDIEQRRASLCAGGRRGECREDGARRLGKEPALATLAPAPPRTPLTLSRAPQTTGKLCELNFFEAARLDGLVRRTEEIGVKVTEVFDGRDDLLTYVP